jgi:hypothetical protein
MGKACSTHRGNEKFIQNFLSENPKGRDLLEDVGVDSRIILKLTLVR